MMSIILLVQHLAQMTDEARAQPAASRDPSSHREYYGHIRVKIRQSHGACLARETVEGKTDDSENAGRLRQSTPFEGMLTQEEWCRILRNMNR